MAMPLFFALIKDKTFKISNYSVFLFLRLGALTTPYNPSCSFFHDIISIDN